MEKPDVPPFKFHLTEILENADYSIVTESGSVVTWGCLGRGKRKRSQREGHKETLEVMYIFIFLVMHDSFMGVYVCQIVYFKYV